MQAAVRLHDGGIDERGLSNRENTATAADVKDVLSQLDARQRIALKLHYVNGYSYEEIARLTGWTRDSVKTHIQNGKRMFKLLWDRKAMGTGK